MTKKINYKELPEILPIFPLPGVIILPYGSLPLNIFEQCNMDLSLVGTFMPHAIDTYLYASMET